MPINARLPLPSKTRFSLRSILLIVMLTILAMPLGGLYFFRIYENELVKQTELELIGQAAVLAATFRQLVREKGVEDYGYIQFSRTLTEPRAPYEAYREVGEDYYTPIMPSVDLIDPISPPRPDPLPSTKGIDPVAKDLGERMAAILRDTQKITLSGLRILDLNGTVIAGGADTRLSFSHVDEVKQALQGQYASVIRQRNSDGPPPLYSMSRGTHIRVFIAFPVTENGRLQGVVYLSRTPKNVIKHLYENRGKVFSATLVLVGLAVLLVLLVSSTISRPIRELLQQTERVRKGEQREVEPLPTPVTREVAQLSESFAGMSHSLAERSDYIRRFATHVSHEFKTPLTSMQGALELLSDHLDSMPPERSRQFIGNLLADTQRLKQLVNRLLEMARADSLEPSNYASTLPVVFRGLENRYHERGLRLKCRNPLPASRLAIAPDALESILTNLLDNSLQHGADCVDIHSRVGKGILTLRMHDNGEGISAANRDKVFTPFFTTKRKKGGTGLGLEIIVSILKAYHGGIRLEEVEQGAAFTLELPVVGS